ncbi:hypothetical protein DP939_15060 [Spongiactinospora rosea]|uniref:Uncharacterized protein n=1 Tax=Spongiactinospora rosea TaxID=2248750 RepID=A0A366M1E2_9ACTN|nr:hypothetical protein [Spongiactinospora rosea]RBQ19252.1 hypothetical protein DP939_15060 [Spongiactinospora rosea]
MRFVSRILIGVGAATAIAVAAPAAASATVTAGGAATASAVTGTTQWGPYYSADRKSKATGEVSVERKHHKVYYKKKHTKWVKHCWWHKGAKKCKPVKKTWWTKHSKWVRGNEFTVESKLRNEKRWGDRRYRCAWETFKVVTFDGSSYLRSFDNCGRYPERHSFDGKDAKRISVQVSRGNGHSPKGRSGGWHEIYSAF